MAFCWIKVKVSKCDEICKETLTNKSCSFKILLRWSLVIYLWYFAKQSFTVKSTSTALESTFSINNFFSKLRIWSFLITFWRELRIWTYLLMKTLMKNFIFVQCNFPITYYSSHWTWSPNVFHTILFLFCPRNASKTLLSWLLVWNIDDVIS